VPANHKWVSRAIVARVVTRTIEGLKLKFPEVPPAKKDQIEAARKQLQQDERKK
jgi:hypothetical protein